MDCSIFEQHKFIYDPDQSRPERSVFVCICGKEQIEHEDSTP